ncbi:hypothetical protein EPN18_03340 [bacterium]|nr:MAG: hypothetical protein EPN18_03340 [bacterium]
MKKLLRPALYVVLMLSAILCLSAPAESGVTELGLVTGRMFDGTPVKIDNMGSIGLEQYQGAIFENINMQIDAVAADISLSDNRFNDSLGVIITLEYADFEVVNMPITAHNSREINGALKWFSIPIKKTVARIKLTGGGTNVATYVWHIKLKTAN